MTHDSDHGDSDSPRWNKPESPDNQWDTDSLELAEYVGLTLYVDLADRMRTLDVPEAVINALIRTMIDMHDDAAMMMNQARVTMVSHTSVSGAFMDVNILAADECGDIHYD